MKRRRTILLLVLYLLVFAFTIAMEYFSIMNPGRRLLVNGSTFLMALVSGVLFWLIYRGDRQREDAKEKVEGNEVVEESKVVEGNEVVEGDKGNVAGETDAEEENQASMEKSEIDNEVEINGVDEVGSDEASVHESEEAKVDEAEVAESEALEVDEDDSEEPKAADVEVAEVAESDTDEVQKGGELPQVKEHRQTVMEKSEKTQEDVLFDKGKYLDFANSHQLTRREAEIGLLVMNGYSNMQIAETLFIAETTVKKHLSHIYEKAGISGRKEFRQSVNAWNNTGGD